MALTFPLTVEQFFARLPVSDISFTAPAQNMMDMTGGGDILTADVGPQLWQTRVTLGTMTKEEASWAGSMLDVLQVAGRSFMAHDLRRPFPRHDRDGALLAGRNVTLQTAAGRELRLQGLPAAYRITGGDYVAFAYGQNPTRRALHRVVTESAVANASGLSPVLEVTPMIRPGAAGGAAVTLIRPACKMVLVPGSIEPGRSFRTITTGMAFSAIQTLR